MRKFFNWLLGHKESEVVRPATEAPKPKLPTITLDELLLYPEELSSIRPGWQEPPKPITQQEYDDAFNKCFPEFSIKDIPKTLADYGCIPVEWETYRVTFENSRPMIINERSPSHAMMYIQNRWPNMFLTITDVKKIKKQYGPKRTK